MSVRPALCPALASALFAAGLASCSKPVPILGNVKAVSAGAQHTCVLMADGAVRCWGSNSHGQVGARGTAESPLPAQVEEIADASVVSAGQLHTCAVLAGGKVKCWGANAFGQLGNGERPDSAVPVYVKGIEDAVQVTAGWSHTCAVRSGGGIKCWGLNASAQLGTSPSESKEKCAGSTGEMPCSRVPVDVEGVEANSVSAGGDYNCALLKDSTAACWGSNTHSQLGITAKKEPDQCDSGGFLHGCSAAPHAVEKAEAVSAVAAGGYHSCVLGGDSGVKCWGPNHMGQLSTGRQKGSAKPVEAHGLSGVVSISAGLMHNCAVIRDGTVRCWGSNNAGQLGATTGRTAHAGAYSDEKRSTLPFAVKGLANVVSVSCGAEHTCAVFTNGTAACWGGNQHGKLGDGTTKNSIAPVFVRAPPQR